MNPYLSSPAPAHHFSLLSIERRPTPITLCLIPVQRATTQHPLHPTYLVAFFLGQLPARMSAFISLSGALLLALSLKSVFAQVPTTTPQCVRTCGTVKVSEGYCANSAVFTTAFTQCLRDNCNSAEAASGLGLASAFCGAANGAANNTPPTVPPSTPSTPAPLPGANGNATIAPTANGNSTGTNSTVANVLRGAGYATLASLVDSPGGQAFASQLQQGPHTVFAPTDSALAQLPVNTTNPGDLTALLSYHTVPGTLDASRLPTNAHAIVRTALRGPPYVNLPANDSQVLVLGAQPNGSLRIIEATRNITVLNGTRLDRLELAAVPNALTVPGTIAATAASIPELSTLVSAVNAAAPQLFQQLDQTPGLTIFAPINAALGNAPPNGNFQGVLLNHIVNGTVLYSTTIANVTNATSAGGARIDFVVNGTGTYAREADRTLLIVQSDIITRNGVIHLVNGLFQPSNSTPTFPLINQNNSSETVGITQVDGANNTSPAGQNAQSSGLLRFSTSAGLLAAVLTISCGALTL